MLHRSSVLTVATLLGGALLVSVPATAAGETCQGRPATIVGTGPDIQGTPGDDVIVTGASSRTDAGAGDDLVCVSSSDHGSVFVFAGDGDDVVDASASNPTWVLRTVYLGTGLDHYVGNVGGPTQGDVHANGADDNVADATTVLLQVTDALTGPRGTYSVGGLDLPPTSGCGAPTMTWRSRSTSTSSWQAEWRPTSLASTVSSSRTTCNPPWQQSRQLPAGLGLPRAPSG